MGIKCRLFGHSWDNYKEDVEVTHSDPYSSSREFKITILTSFRICKRCYHKQERVAWTNKDSIDWRNCELSKEQLRDKNLESLGI
jgi:hypothetical protein